MSWLSRTIWRHNALHGSVARAQLAMEAILESATTTPEAMQIAANIRPLLGDLRQALKIRREIIQ